ncbi:MAG: hypothetical protein FWG93_00430, partial [Oscillospiraceae bacterium]|nr:hypothetical protein [Oscillospiraceae bacterium]
MPKLPDTIRIMAATTLICRKKGMSEKSPDENFHKRLTAAKMTKTTNVNPTAQTFLFILQSSLSKIYVPITMYNLKVYAGCRGDRPGRPRTPY